jgi:hypothetical protein
MSTDRDFPRSDPRAADYDGSSQIGVVPATSRDLPFGHSRANDNPTRSTAAEEGYAWVCAFNPKSMQDEKNPPPPPPGQPTGELPQAKPAPAA